VVTEPAVIAELREQLLAWERELSKRESTLLAREHGVVEGKRALGRAVMECDAIHDQVASVRGTIYPVCAHSPPIGGALWSLTRF
jgi:hypothetical protein